MYLKKTCKMNEKITPFSGTDFHFLFYTELFLQLWKKFPNQPHFSNVALNYSSSNVPELLLSSISLDR